MNGMTRYPGYELYQDLCQTVWFVRRGGMVVATCGTVDAARAAVDAIVGNA